MINPIFLQTFFDRKPDAEQIIRQAIFLDTQARFFIARGNAAANDERAHAAYTTAIDMAETADHLRAIVAEGTWHLYRVDEEMLDLFPAELARVA